MGFFYLSANLLAMVVSAKYCITMKIISFWAEDFKRYHFFSRCNDTRVPFCFIFLISISCFKESVSQNNFNWSSSFLYQTQDIRQTMSLSSPIFLLTMTTTWTSQLLVQNWSKTPVNSRYHFETPSFNAWLHRVPLATRKPYVTLFFFWISISKASAL